MNQEKIVFIEWVDSVKSTQEWEFADEIIPLIPAICYSVGFLYEDTDGYVTIIETKSDNQIMGRLTIPRPAIKKMVPLVDWELVDAPTENKESK